MRHQLLSTAVLILSLHTAAIAQSTLSTTQSATPVSQPQPLAEGDVGSVELSAGTQTLSNGLGRWRDVTLRGTYNLPSHVLQGELSVQDHFNERGVFVGVSDTYTFNEDYFGSLALGVGDGAFFLPRYRVDATLYKKWLDNKSLVTSLGVGYYSAPDGHADRGLSVGAAYYFESPWVLEGGIRFNSSSPGDIRTNQKYVAVTYGRNKQDLVSLRFSQGGEGYQTIGSSMQLVNFDSRETSLSWRHWVSPRAGVAFSANRYTNPSYRRTGGTIGIFHDF